jgi:hypothetical protein
VKYALWIVQVGLALAFFAGGFLKLTQPYEALGATMVWVNDVPEALVRFIGLAEVLGAIGLVAPAATRILPWLTPLAAALLALDMLLATLFHLVRGEFAMMPVPIVQGALAAFVAYGRWSLVPIQPRGAQPVAAWRTPHALVWWSAARFQEWSTLGIWALKWRRRRLAPDSTLGQPSTTST